MLACNHHLVSAAIIAATSVGIGFYIGLWANPSSRPYREIIQYSEEERDDEDISDGDLAAIQAVGPCKLVLIVRTDVNMTPGAISEQCGRATLACYKALVKKNLKLVQHWDRTGEAKIALKAKSEEQLLELEAIAKSLNLCARSVQDSGLAEGSRVVLGIGPAPVELVNEVSGELRLL